MIKLHLTIQMQKILFNNPLGIFSTKVKMIVSAAFTLLNLLFIFVRRIERELDKVIY